MVVRKRKGVFNQEKISVHKNYLKPEIIEGSNHIHTNFVNNWDMLVLATVFLSKFQLRIS